MASILDRIKRNRITKMTHAISNWWDDILFPGLSGTKYDYARKVGSGQDASVLMAPVLWVAKQSVQAPPEVLKLEGDEDVRQIGHPLTRLLNKPNPAYTGKALQMGTIACMLTSLDAYWIKIRNRDGSLAEMWLAAPGHIRPMNFDDPVDLIDFYEYNPKGTPQKLLPQDVVHFRIGVNYLDPRHGFGILHALLREVFTDIEAANFTATLLRNMGVPGIILSPASSEVGVKIDDPKGLKEKFMAAFSGDSRGEPMVNSIAVKVEQFGFSPDEMKLGDIRNIPEERVCSMIGVAPSVVHFGTGEQQTKVGATAAENRRSSWEDGVIPYLDIMAETIGESLLPDFGEDSEISSVNYRLSGVRALRESQDAIYKRVSVGINGGWLRVDTGQAMAGLEPDDTQKIYLRRGNQLEIPAGDLKTQYMSGRFGGKERRGRYIKAVRAAEHGTKAAPTRDQARLMAQFNRDIRVLEPPFEKEMLGFLQKWAGIIADAADKILSPKQITETTLRETQLIMDSVDLAAMEQGLKDLYEGQYARTGTTTLNSLNSVMGITIASPDTVAIQTVAAGGRQAGLVDLPRSVRNELFRILTQAEEAGLGVPETVRQIRDTVTAGRFRTPEIRARVIARTETLHAQRESSLATYRQMPDVINVLVFDARLGETDEECANLDGTTVTISDAETLSAEEHPNGTRAFAPIVT